MTERLYYDNPYLTEFEAHVTCVRPVDDKFEIALDQSAFYPTSGGQPFDLGTINEIAVEDVNVDKAGEVWHLVSKSFEAGESVHGIIDWKRRFDHMQQHAADHMIAGALHRMYNGVTIGLHLGEETSTIDVAMPDGVVRLSEEDIRKIELDVNEHIQKNVPIRCWFTNEEELKTLPLRKAPTVTEHVRIVAIGDDEMVACGGTHPKFAGEVGLVKILSATPARGKMRVCFVAGMRAFRDYQLKHDAAQNTAVVLSTSVDRISVNVAAMQEQLRRAESELNHLKKMTLMDRIPGMIDKAVCLPGDTRLVCEEMECDVSIARDVVNGIIKHEKTIALVRIPNEEKNIFIFARSADVDVHMGKLLGASAKPFGGKGGGKPDFAQGGGQAEILEEARRLLMEEGFKA